MNENESRPLADAEVAEYWEATARLYCEAGESYQAKAAALDKILAAWGMTWDEYKQQPGTDATGEKKCD